MKKGEPATTVGDPSRTEVGSVFVSNYPPYSAWSADRVEPSLQVLDSPPAPGTTLGLYLHVPFCRKRCKFCYFKVYTDKNSREVESYMEAMAREVELWAERGFVGGRSLKYVYFGGGTPSYLSVEQLQYLFGELQARMPWDQAEELTFECEPGTLQEKKITGSMMGSNRFRLDMPRYVGFYLDGRLKLDEMISSRISLEDVNGALEKLRAGEAARQVIVFDA